MNRRFSILAALALVFVLAGAAFAAYEPGTQMTVGFIFVGPVGDYGWSYAHNEGRLAVGPKGCCRDPKSIASVEDRVEDGSIRQDRVNLATEELRKPSVNRLTPTGGHVFGGGHERQQPKKSDEQNR